MRNKRIYILFALLGINVLIFSQENWEVPENEKEKLSIRIFDEELRLDGQRIYNLSCVSCHGSPTQANFTMMVPSPGDVASGRFQQQPDGELFYKIQKGRGPMPSFENTYAEDEIWSLIAYIRSFHKGYQQQMPNLEGIEIPQLEIELGYDENVDKLVVKVSDDKNEFSENVAVKGYVKGMFGNHFLGKAETNEFGIAYIDIDANLPGDSDGKVMVLIKATKGYGSARLEQKIAAARQTISKSVIEGRHLWSKAKKAPWWMIIAFNMIGIGIWGTIIYIIIGLRKIKKLQ